jgi:hypothetical protein
MIARRRLRSTLGRLSRSTVAMAPTLAVCAAGGAPTSAVGASSANTPLTMAVIGDTPWDDAQETEFPETDQPAHDGRAGRYPRSRSLITGSPPRSSTANGTTSSHPQPNTVRACHVWAVCFGTHPVPIAR